MDLRQSKEFAQYLESRGWLVEKDNQDFIFVRKIPLTPFSIIKIQRPQKISFEKVEEIGKKHRALVIYLEPNQAIKIPKGYRLSRSPFLPTKTIQLELTQSEKSILAQMKKDARYNLRKAERNKIKFARNTPEKFHQAWKKSVNWRRHVPSLNSLHSLRKAFGDKAFFLSASQNGKTIAGTLILAPKKTAYYYYAFTSGQGRKELAQYLLVWEAIKMVKEKGAKIFDFEGIYDERFPIKAWHGFSHFKQSFGGKKLEHPGCLVKKSFPF